MRRRGIDRLHSSQRDSETKLSCQHSNESAIGPIGSGLTGASGDPSAGIGCVRLVARNPIDGAEIDRLCTDEDERVEVRLKSDERVEKDASCVHVLLPNFLHGSSAVPSREEACHLGARWRIHASSASPSCGMRPNPVKQSIATWQSDAKTSPSRSHVRSNTIGS